MEMTLGSACKRFFGFKPGETLKEFMDEIRELNEKDREDLKVEFAKVGIEVVPTVK